MRPRIRESILERERYLSVVQRRTERRFDVAGGAAVDFQINVIRHLDFFASTELQRGAENDFAAGGSDGPRGAQWEQRPNRRILPPIGIEADDPQPRLECPFRLAAVRQQFPSP